MAAFDGPNIVTGGLLALLDASNPRSNTNSATTWFDISGNRNNFTLAGSPTWQGSGTQQYINLNDTTNFAYGPTFTSTGGYTVSIAMMFTNFVAGNFLVASELDAPSITLYILQSGGSIGFSTNGVGLQYVNIATNILYIWDWTVDVASTLGSVYQNGLLVSSSSVSTIGLSGAVNFGGVAGHGSTANFYRCALYNRALTSTEVSNNFNAIRGRYGL